MMRFTRRFLTPSLLLLLALAPAQAEEKQPIRERLAQRVPELRKKKKLIGLAAMVMVDSKMVASHCDGERSRGSGKKLTVNDRWHIGSITKSITSTVIGRLVEKGTIDWDDTVGELAPDWKTHPDWRPVTLTQLMTHTAGAPSNFSSFTQFIRPAEGPKRIEARRAAVLAVLKTKPKGEPGKVHRYSNVGYTIAGALLETKLNKSWEDLVREEVFEPLKLDKAGFGPPKDDKKKLDQPRGHQKLGPFKRAVGTDEDNTPIMGPAGIVHMSLENLCTYGNEHLKGERGVAGLLQVKTMKWLHTPRLRKYACGWVVWPKSERHDQRLVWHNGSNTMWYALLAIVPEKNAVIAITSNDGDIRGAEDAGFQIVREIASLID